MEWDIKIKSKWEDSQARYSNGKHLLIGKVKVATVFYDGATDKGSLSKYALTTNMEGIKSHLGHFVEESEAMKKAESVLDFWIKKYLCDINKLETKKEA